MCRFPHSQAHGAEKKKAYTARSADQSQERDPTVATQTLHNSALCALTGFGAVMRLTLRRQCSVNPPCTAGNQ